MNEFFISDADLAPLKGQVVVCTGSASGIGLATCKMLTEQLGAYVVGGDLFEPREPVNSDNFTYVKTNVTKWDELKNLFKTAVDKYGKVDHVFANAGVFAKVPFVEEGDENGEPRPSDHNVYAVNFIAVADTLKLGIHWLQKNPNGGSVVMTASSSAYQRFARPEYCSTKHAVLGLMRSLYDHLYPKLPIRVNTLAPSWTVSGMVTKPTDAEKALRYQTPYDVARSAAICMADGKRNSQLIYSCQGRYTEFEEDLIAAADNILQRAGSLDDWRTTQAVDANALREAMKVATANAKATTATTA